MFNMNVELASGHGQGMVIDAVRYEGNEFFFFPKPVFID